MAITNGNYLNPSLIENTTMLEKLRDGVLYAYAITPADGYVLHDKGLDAYDGGYTEEGEPIGNLILGYTTGTTTCAASYDFVANPREFYADQIFGGGNNHESM